MATDDLHVQWRVSWYDLRHGLPREVAPYVVVAAVAGAWVVAPHLGGSHELAWLGLAVLALQVVIVGHTVARRLQARRAADRVLTLHGSSFVLVDSGGTTVFDAPLVGVDDDRGVLRLDFADGSRLEAPWRAFTNAGLRRVRRHLRVRAGIDGGLDHVPLRRVGEPSGAAAWRRPRIALAVAAGLALLPWLLAASS